MKRKLSSDVWVLAGLLVLLVILGLMTGRRQRGGSEMELTPRRTSYSSKPGGVKALYETLDKLGYRVQRRLQPLATAPPDGVFLIIQPEAMISTQEWRTLRDWVEQGNLLIVTAGTFIPSTEEKQPSDVSVAVCPSFLVPDVKSYRVAELERIEEKTWNFQDSNGLGAPAPGG